MRYLVGFICVLALGVMWCSGESDGICRGSLSDYCAKVECPTWDEAVAEAQCDGFWEVGTCEDLGYVFHWFGFGDHWVKYFDTSGALVAVESWSDTGEHCDFMMSNSILYGPVPHCDRCAAPFSDYCLFECPTWNAEPQCEGFEATLVDASDCYQANNYCASNCPLQDREECIEQYLSTGSCGLGGTGGRGGCVGSGGSGGAVPCESHGDCDDGRECSEDYCNSEGICRHELFFCPCEVPLSCYCSGSECPTWEQAVAEAQKDCDNLEARVEAGRCGDFQYVEINWEEYEVVIQYFDATDALVARTEWVDYDAFECSDGHTAFSILYGPVPACELEPERVCGLAAHAAAYKTRP